MDDIERPAEARDSVWQRVVQLAQALCADAALYGGHACLCCQQAAQRLVGLSEEGRGGWPADAAVRATAMALPLHGTSLKASQSHWQLLVSSLSEEGSRSG